MCYMENKKISILKNVKIIVLYQNIGGHGAYIYKPLLKISVGGGVGEELPLLLNIIYIIGCCSLLFIGCLLVIWLVKIKG